MRNHRVRLARICAFGLVVLLLAPVMARAVPEPITTVQFDSFVHHAALSPSGEYLAVACDDGAVRLVETESWGVLWETQLHDTGAVSAVAFAPDGSEVVAGLSGEADVVFLNALTGEESRRLSLYGPPLPGGYYDEDMFVYVTSMALSSDG